MSAEYLIHLSDGTTDGPYTEEDLLDMVDADELSAGAICEDTVTGKRMRVRQLFQVIPPTTPSIKSRKSIPSIKSKPHSPNSRPGEVDDYDEESDSDEGDEDDYEDEEEEGDEDEDEEVRPNHAAHSPNRARWVPAPYPQDAAAPHTPFPRAADPFPPRVRTFYHSSPSLLTYPFSLLLALAMTAGGWYAGRWDGNFLAGGWIAGCVVLALVLLARSTSDYRVTTRRVEARRGLISKSSREIRIADIRSITVEKTGLKGILGVGTVIFSAESGPEEDVIFHNIWRAHGVKDLVRLLQDRPE